MNSILGVCSAGGHSIQLKLILSPLATQAEVHILTSSSGVFNNGLASVDESLADFNRLEAYRAPWLFMVCLYKLIKLKPSLVVSTGALPGVVCIAAARLLGIKTLWIDSIANSKKLSLSGKIAKKIAHKTLSQWPDVAKNEGVDYQGKVL